jgi:hypothetical protein
MTSQLANISNLHKQILKICFSFPTVLLAIGLLQSFVPCTAQQNTRSQRWQRDSDGNWWTRSPKSASLWVQIWKDSYSKLNLFYLRIHELFLCILEWGHLGTWTHSTCQILNREHWITCPPSTLARSIQLNWRCHPDILTRGWTYIQTLFELSLLFRKPGDKGSQGTQ